VPPLLIDDRIAALRACLTTTHTAQFRRLYEQCQWYRGQHPPAEHPTASITYLGPAAANLALAYRLTGQRGYLDEAWRWIGTAIGYPHWGKAHLPDHDLDAGWLLHGLSLAYSWLRDDLPEQRAGALRDKLALQGHRMYEHAVATEGRWWSSSYWQNHNWICYTGLATAGYALDSPQWTERAKQNFAIVKDLLPGDGSDCEGVVYWRYGVPWLAAYTDLLASAEGVDWWDSFEFLKNTFWYRLHQCAPGFQENIDHGDCHDRRSGHSVALYYQLAARYGIGEAQWLADQVARQHLWREAYASGVKPGIMPEAYLELLWYDPDVAPVAPPASTPTTAYFPDLGLVTARTGWHDDAAMVSFKAAPGGGHRAWRIAAEQRAERGWEVLSAGHHHPDAGSFVYTAHGEFLAIDEGYSNHKQAAHHNLVLVDGQGWADEGRYHVYQDMREDRQPCLRDVLAADGFAHATAQTAAMYPDDLGVTRLDRTLVFTPGGRLVLLDTLAANTPRRWTLLLHSDWPAEITDAGPIAIRSGPAQAWVSQPWAGVAVSSTQEVTEVRANPTASTPSLVIAKTMHTVRTTTVPAAAAVLGTAIEPVPALAPTPPRARRVECTAGFGVDFAAAAGTSAETVLLAPVHRWIAGQGVLARAAAVMISSVGGPRRVAVVGATEVSIDGVPVWSSEDPYTGVLEKELDAWSGGAGG
jgi:hypothetical protein